MKQKNLEAGKTIILASAFIAAFITLLVYLPALNNGFVNWDDNRYVYENPNIRAINLRFFKWAFADVDVVLGNWHPLTTISYAIDYSIWGLNPFGFHLTNIVFHAIDTFLAGILAAILYGFIDPGERGIKSRAAFIGLITALLFGLHPLHVESVAWISERKDVLSVFFFLLSILAYLKYASISPKKYLHYIAALFAFALALMSKPMAVTLPIVLLILDFYPLERFFDGKGNGLKKALTEKVPFFALSALSALLTLWAQKKASAVVPLENIPFVQRLFTAIRGYIFYLYKMAVPLNLTPYYPFEYHPDPSKISYFTFEYTGSLILLCVITVFCAITAKRHRIYSAAWLYYIITLAPVIGIIQVGAQETADRYAYLPSLSPFILIAAGAGYLIKRFPKKQVFSAVAAAAVVISIVLAGLTLRQIAVWKDTLSLWSKVIDVFPFSVPVSYYNRGREYQRLGDYRRAVEDLSISITLNPGDAGSYVSRGISYGELGMVDRAVKDFDRAIELDPKNPDAYLNRGVGYLNSGNYATAVEDLKKAIELNPGNGYAYYNLGLTYLKTGDTGAAVFNIKKAADMGIKPALDYLKDKGLPALKR